MSYFLRLWLYLANLFLKVRPQVSKVCIHDLSLGILVCFGLCSYPSLENLWDWASFPKFKNHSGFPVSKNISHFFYRGFNPFLFNCGASLWILNINLFLIISIVGISSILWIRFAITAQSWLEVLSWSFQVEFGSSAKNNVFSVYAHR